MVFRLAPPMVLLFASLAAAQAAPQEPSASPSDEAAVPAMQAADSGGPAEVSPPAPEPVDPSKLPVSLGRIRLQLGGASATKTSGLKIQETIEVVGVAPKVELWNNETAKLATGPVPWGAPTHKEFIDLVTPQEFKTYPFDINALMEWLLAHLGEKKSAE